MNRSEALLRDIETFLRLTGIKPTNLGRIILNDPGFVTKLRKGRRVWPETEAKVRQFIDAYARVKAA